MATCDGCGAHVTSRYHAVFAIDGVLYSCQECGTKDANHRPGDGSRNGDLSIASSDSTPERDENGRFVSGGEA